MATFLDWNPMQGDLAILVKSSRIIQFPTHYKFQCTVHQLDEFATMHVKVQVVSNMGKCMHAANDACKNVYMAGCTAGNLNQDFFKVPATRQIMLRSSGECVDIHTLTYNVYMGSTIPSQSNLSL